jgi:Peptidase S46
LSTMKQIEAERDIAIPETIKLIKRRLAVLRRYASAGTEPARQAMTQIFGLENSLKVYLGEYNGLLDKTLIAQKQKDESDFRARVAANRDMANKYGKAWDEIAGAQQKRMTRYKESRYRSVRASQLASLAFTIVQYVAEVKKPDGQRLDGFHDSQLESLRFQIFSPAPFYPQMEIALLADSFQESLDALGSSDPYVKAVLNGRSAEEAANQVIGGTRLNDPAYRKELIEGGPSAVDASKDPAIMLARAIDPFVREIRKWMEDTVESVMTSAGEKIGHARFAVYGKGAYPDATFTLRLAYGTVKEYAMNGTEAPPKTTFYGLYDRSLGFDGKDPFQLPARYIERRDSVDLSTPLNFVNTCDIIGGNSGSPVINRNGEIVGLIFDGNIESLVSDYVYNEVNNRAVAVHTGAMLEALRKLYDALDLANELTIHD